MSYRNISSSGYGRKKASHFPTSPQPKSVLRPKQWDPYVEEAYRFQVAGYRDEKEYKHLQNDEEVDRWPDTGYVKKLQRKDGTFYYYSKARECKEKDVNRTKLYAY
ncbi:meiosis expressed gene 1 protein homolog [Clytia hemisphaerica]|uniref:Meiosis expressed gene 1 protein homolog n=1 Tax=Clytia hemisphaerica TaxID=252671 RepID=A0A7M5VDR5_9CNID|eukprot:TCONS_00004400-protein